MSAKHIEIVGARTHNLKNISTSIPLGKITVVTGVSGSGKSSLAFDTLYAEGQRRYVESLSTYARQFIEKMARPDVDQVRNVQPAIAIEQKNSVKNARSTIGTATEIHDYLRLLFARAGVTICPFDQSEVREDTPQSVAHELLRTHSGRRAQIVGPVASGETVSASSMKVELLRAGFSRVIGNDDQILDLDETSDETFAALLREHTANVLIDRVSIDEKSYERIASSLAVAFQAGHGTAEIRFADDAEPRSLRFHAGFRCNICGREYTRPEPNIFSFNSPIGACSECSGFGRVIGVDWDKVLPDRSLTLDQKPVVPFNTPKYRKNYKWLKAASLPTNVPLDQFTRKQYDVLLYGDGEFEGLQQFFKWLEEERYKVQNRILMARYRGFSECPRCRGSRLVGDALQVWWNPADGSMPRRTLPELTAMSIGELLADFAATKLTPHEEELYGRIFREILSRLSYLVRVGLGYLTLDRQTRTLSGGESQRINLATALGTSLTQTLYVLDEPTVGLHPRDSLRLLEIMRNLRDNGNTLVVVEHDPDMILGADHLIDLGPRAGSHGGEIIFSGSPAQLSDGTTTSLTAEYLKHRPGDRPAVPGKKKTRARERSLKIIGAREHNLKGIDVRIPLGRWVCITGVSGSGKSTLVHNILYQGFNQHKHLPSEDVGSFKKIDGLEHLDEIILIDQAPIGRSVRSNPVTYVKAYDAIRKLFASTREARALGLTEGNFSFNVAGGRCERCEGTGVVTYDMHFLAEMTLPCDVCDGRRFQPRVLEVHFHGKSIHDVLSMTIDDATHFFSGTPAIGRKLWPLRAVGLRYLTLGQNTSSLSGGEAQRLKLASHLTSGADGTGKLMIFDEPTTGLHLADLDVLSEAFRQLVERNYSLVIVEHNLEIIRQADWIIDLGPEGGNDGGYLLVEGTPEQVTDCKSSHTGRFLRALLAQ